MVGISGIRDWLDRKVLNRQVSKNQSTDVAALNREFAGHPSRGLTPGRLASILQSAEGGNLVDQCDLFEDMEEKDAHIFAELSKRKRVLQGLNWRIVPPLNPSADEEKRTEALQEIFEDLDNFEDTIFDMADAIGKGYSNLEIDWRLEQKLRIPHLTHRPARWFTIDENDRNKLLLRNDTGKGEELWPFGWVSHVHKAKSGYVARGGLHRILAWPYLFKNYSVRDLAEFLEIYGIPLRLGTYPQGASKEEKMTLLRAVTSIGHSAAGIKPEGMLIEMLEAAKGGSDPYTAMIGWCEASQSKAILGGTLTTSAESTGLGSNLGDVHNEVRLDLRDSDAKQIAGTLTRDLVWPVTALNFSGTNQSRTPRFEFILQEEEDLEIRVERDKTLYDMGHRITSKKVEEIYGEGYEFIDNDDKPDPEPEKDQAATAAASAAKPEPDYTDNQVQQLQDATDPALIDMQEQIKQLLDEVDTMEEFQDRLIEAFNYLDIDSLAETIQEAMSAAELAGRFDVQEGE